MKNKIGWCDITWNPVWGCLNNCEYCYARKIAKRFWAVMLEKEFYYYYYDKEHPNWVWTGLEGEYTGMDEFKPVFLKSQFNKKFPKNPQRIFVGSMSEIAHWEKEWIEKVIEKTKEYSQHTFQFLTKFPGVYSKYDFPNNCWLGTTVVNNDELYKMDFVYANRIKFISIEPILEKIDERYIEYINTGNFFNIVYQKINWVILGAESGNRRGKIIPKKEWIEDIVECCKDNNIPVYLKDSLKEIYLVEIKEFPEECK